MWHPDLFLDSFSYLPIFIPVSRTFFLVTGSLFLTSLLFWSVLCLMGFLLAFNSIYRSYPAAACPSLFVLLHQCLYVQHALSFGLLFSLYNLPVPTLPDPAIIGMLIHRTRPEYYSIMSPFHFSILLKIFKRQKDCLFYFTFETAPFVVYCI